MEGMTPKVIVEKIRAMHTGQSILGSDTYTLEERIEGRNPIYRARAQKSGKTVVVKGYDTKDAFFRESQITRRLRHACILPLMDAVADTSGEYTVFPYIHGETLKSFLRYEGTIEGRHLLGIMPALCDALASIHNAGIIHADIKPANILLARCDNRRTTKKSDLYPVTHVIKPYLFDFDIAYDARAGTESSPDLIRGTPYYLAPENWYGEPPSQESDLYALGVTLYEMMTTSLPFSGEIYEIMSKHNRAPIPDPREQNPNISAELAMVVQHALAKDPCNRYHNTKEFKEDLLLAVI